jgi:hypothetical protein
VFLGVSITHKGDIPMTIGDLKALLASYDDSLEVTIDGDPVEDVYTDEDDEGGAEYVVLSCESPEG